jgi:hypothetical protein
MQSTRIGHALKELAFDDPDYAAIARGGVMRTREHRTDKQIETCAPAAPTPIALLQARAAAGEPLFA